MKIHLIAAAMVLAAALSSTGAFAQATAQGQTKDKTAATPSTDSTDRKARKSARREKAKADAAVAQAKDTAAKPAAAAPAAAAKTAASSAAAPAAGAKTAAKGGGATQNATAPQIAAAKASGMVWVNTGTGVWHTEGEYYGATKEGKFMTAAEAAKAGYRAAKEPVKGSKK